MVAKTRIDDDEDFTEVKTPPKGDPNIPTSGDWTQQPPPAPSEQPVPSLEDAARAVLADCPASYAESQWRPSPESIEMLKQALADES
jgi:hypothetical protein